MSRHIGIAIPCMDQVDAWFAHDLARAMTHHAFAFPDDTIALSMHQSAFLAESRNELVKGLLENEGVDYVIFLDSDMRFPATLFNDLLSHDVPVVAANCAKRRRPISATARRQNPETGKMDAVWPDPDKKEGVEQIDIVGAAVMCIKRDVFFQIEYPWFHTPWLAEDQRFVGEDLYFCAQLKKHNQALYIDHGISWQIRHIGQYEYGMNDVLGERELAQRGYWDHLRKDAPEKLIEVVKA